MSKNKLFGCVAAAALVLGFAFAPVYADQPVPEKQSDIFDGLDDAVVWYRQVMATETTGISTREAFLQSSLQQSALRSLRYSFDFARIQAGLLQRALDEAKAIEATQVKEETKVAEEKPDGEKPFDPVRVKAAIGQKIARIQEDLTIAKRQTRTGKAPDRANAAARIEKLNAELALAKTQDDLIANVLSLATVEETQSLEKQIDDLASSLPELEKKTVKTVAATPATPNAAVNAAAQMLMPGLSLDEKSSDDPAAETKGAIRLVRDLLARLNQKQDMSELLAATKSLQAENASKIEELRESIITIVKHSNELSVTNGASVEETNNQSAELTTMNGQFKDMADLIVPLSKQRRSLTNAVTMITDWQGLFDADIANIFRRIVVRLVTLLLAVAIPFLISEVARRALTQYILDARRRRQLNVVRRVVLIIIVLLVILLNLVSELGSLATFIGFVTAGIAVALQNVILSAVAYFFFFGRYGIKVGSRVTVYGTTGDVIETGLVRLYLMEMVEEKGQYRATGRIVAFPNSILFQPTAFFKQVPGVNYRWHEIIFALEPDTDRVLAREKLNEALESIYNDSKGMIEMQRAAMEQSTRLKVSEPRPEGTVEAKGDVLNFIVRYPIDSERGEEIDKNVTKQIIEIFERLPSIKRLTDDPPIIKKR